VVGRCVDETIGVLPGEHDAVPGLHYGPVRGAVRGDAVLGPGQARVDLLVRLAGEERVVLDVADAIRLAGAGQRLRADDAELVVAVRGCRRDRRVRVALLNVKYIEPTEIVVVELLVPGHGRRVVVGLLRGRGDRGGQADQPVVGTVVE